MGHRSYRTAKKGGKKKPGTRPGNSGGKSEEYWNSGYASPHSDSVTKFSVRASPEAMRAANPFPDYRSWRVYERRERSLTALYELLTLGEAQSFVPESRAMRISQQKSR